MHPDVMMLIHSTSMKTWTENTRLPKSPVNTCVAGGGIFLLLREEVRLPRKASVVSALHKHLLDMLLRLHHACTLKSDLSSLQDVNKHKLVPSAVGIMPI